MWLVWLMVSAVLSAYGQDAPVSSIGNPFTSLTPAHNPFQPSRDPPARDPPIREPPVIDPPISREPPVIDPPLHQDPAPSTPQIAPIIPETPVLPSQQPVGKSPYQAGLPPLSPGDGVAFSYAKAKRSSRPGFIGFARRLVNRNAIFYPEFGVFLCNRPGLYMFTFSAISHKNDPFRLSLVKGYPGEELVHSYSEENGFHSASQSAIIHLVPGDYVYIRLDRGILYESDTLRRAYTTFSGVLIIPDSLVDLPPPLRQLFQYRSLDKPDQALPNFIRRSYSDIQSNTVASV